MPTTDLSRRRKNTEKRTINISTARLSFDEMNLTDDHQILVLPENAIIKNAFVNVKEAADVAITADIGFEGGTGIELFDDVDLVTLGLTEAEVALDTGTGKTIIVTPSAELTQGSFDVVIEYIEYNMSNGQLTNYVLP